MRSTTILRLVAATVALVSGACTVARVYDHDVKTALSSGDLLMTRKMLERPSNRQQPVVTALERAQVEHYSGNWKKSDGLFLDAEGLAEEELRSVGVGGLLASRGGMLRVDPYELGMSSYYRVFNFIALGRISDAAEEALFAKRIVRWSAERLTPGDSGRTLMELGSNAFFDLLSGMLLEWNGTLEEAWISYRNAAVAYHREQPFTGVEPPPWLACDLRRVAKSLEIESELLALQRRFPALAACPGETQGPSTDHGTVAIFIESGWVPEKRLETLKVPVFESDQFPDMESWIEALAIRAAAGATRADPESGNEVVDTLEVIVPKLVSGPKDDIVSVRLQVIVPRKVGSDFIDFAIVEDIGRRAEMTHTIRRPADLAAGIIRAVVNSDENGAEVLDPGSENSRNSEPPENSEILGWQTLPRKIWLFRVDLPAGKFDIYLDFLDKDGLTISDDYLASVEVRAGDWSFFNRRVF